MPIDGDLFETLRLELRRGSLTLGVLAQLHEERYGYTLRQALAADGLEMEESTLYPLLRRLEAQGLLVSEWREEDRRRKRFLPPLPRRRGHAGAPARRMAPPRRLPRQDHRTLDTDGHAMTLVEDYLRAVALLLPKAQRDDIVAELRDTVLSRIEAREAELRRAPTDDETEAVLREIGHPLVVAARYREGPQHVIGPALYPYWLFAVRVAVTIQIGLALIVFFVQSLSGGNVAPSFGHAVSAALTGSATLVGIATAIAWIIERRNIRIGYLDRWRVRDLRGLEILGWNWTDWKGWREGLATGPAPKPDAILGRALGAIAFGSVLVLWWIGALHIALAVDVHELRAAGLDADGLAIDWAALKTALFLPVLVYGLAIVGQGVVILARPREIALHGLLDLAIGAGELALAVWIWTVSILSPAIRVDSIAAFVARARGVVHHGAPLELAPLLMIGVVLAMVIALGRMARGVWEVARWSGPDSADRRSISRKSATPDSLSG